MNLPIVQPEPFAPIADLERRIEALEQLNAALVADQTAMCDLLADKTREVAVLEEKLSALQRKAGTYRLHNRQPEEVTGRYRVQGER